MAWGRPLSLLIYKLGWEGWETNPACGVRMTWTQDISPVHWLLRSFPSCRCHVAALLTLKANIWLDTLTVKQWKIMVNNDVLLFFFATNEETTYEQLLLYCSCGSLIDHPPPPTLPNHISYISKSNNALILLFLLNVMIIIIIIFLSNPKPFSKFFWYPPELLFLVFIQPLY